MMEVILTGVVVGISIPIGFLLAYLVHQLIKLTYKTFKLTIKKIKGEY